MLSRKHIKAPLRYDPGRGHDTEHLAYLNRREMELLRQLTDGEISAGPRGLPSFSITTGATTGSTVSTGGGTKSSATGSTGGSTGGGGGTNSGASKSGSSSGASKSGGTAASGAKTSSGASAGAAKAGPGSTAGSVSPSKSTPAASKPSTSAPAAGPSKASTAPKSSTTMAALGASKAPPAGPPSKSPATNSGAGKDKSGTQAKSSTTQAAAAASAMSKAKTANGAPGKPAPLGGTLGKATAPAKAPAAPAKPSVNGSGTVTAFGGPKVPGGLTQPQKDAYVQAGKVIGAPVGNTGKYRSRGDNAYRDNDGNTVIGRDNKAIGPNFGTDFNKTLQGYQNDVGKALPGRNVSPADVSRFGTNTLNNVFGTDKFGNPRDTERETRTFAGEVGGYPTNDLAAAANAFENNITLGRAWGPTMDRFDANGRDKRVKGGANSAYNAANPGTDAYNQALAGRAAAIDPASDFSLTAPKNVITATNYLTPAAERDQAARAKKVGITGSTWSQTPSFQKTRAEYGPHVFGNAEDTANKVAMARGGPIGGPVISQADRNEYSKGKTDKGGFTTASEKTLGEQVANAFAPKPTARPPGVGVAPKPTARPVGSYTAPGLSFNPALPAQMAAPPIPTARPPMQGPVRGFANLPNRQIAERDSYVNQAPVNAVRPAGPLGGFPAAPVNGVRPSGPLGGFPAAPVNGVRPAGPLGGFPAAAPPPTNGVRPAGPLGGFPAAQPVNGVRPAGPLGGFPAAPVNGVRPEGPLGGFPAAPPNMVRPSGPPGGFPAAPVNGVRPEGPPGGFPAAPVNGVRPEGPLGGFPPAAPPEAGRTLKSRVNADGTLTNYWSNDATPEAAPPQAPAAGVMGLSPVNRAVINGLSRLGETLGDVRIPGIPAADPAFAKWAAARKWAPGLADAAAEKVIGPAVREAAANAIRGIQSFTKPREGAVAGAEPGGFRQADAAPPAAPKNTQKDQSRVPQETSPGREKASEGEEGRRTPSSVKDTPQRTTEADKRPARKGESAGDNRKATGGADRSAAPGGVMPGSSPAARAQGLDARNSGGSNRYEPKRGTRQRDRRPTAAAVAAPAPVLPANNYFQNVTTREEALRQLLGEEWFA